jgi:hypothetical protein
VKASEECTATTEAKMAIIDVTAIMLFAVWTWNVDWRGVEEGDLAGTEKTLGAWSRYLST